MSAAARVIGADTNRRRCRRSELQNLIDPLAEFRDARVNAGLIRRGATDAPTDDSREDPPFVPCPLDDHRTAAVTLRNAEGRKVIRHLDADRIAE